MHTSSTPAALPSGLGLRHTTPARWAVIAVAVALLVATGITWLARPAAAAPSPQTTATSVPLVAATPSQITVDGRQWTLLAEIRPTVTDRYDVLGFSWRAQTGTIALQYRVLRASAWSDWATADAEQDEVGGRGGTSAMFAGGATGVEARVLGQPGATIAGAKASLISSEVVAADTQPTRVTPQAATTGVPRPAYVSRAGWGADESLRSVNGASCTQPSIDTTIKAVIVHHTEGTNDYTAAQSPSIMRSMYRFHVVDRGWCDIGYNLLVDKFGTIFEGRAGGVDYPVRGAHATSWNTNTLGISVMMNSMSAQPSEAVKASLTRAIAWKLANNYRSATGKVILAGKSIDIISGHRDVMSTDCPGTNLYAFLPTLRSQVTQAIGPNTTLKSAWLAAGGETGPLGSVHVLERDLLGGRVTDFIGGTLFLKPDGSILRLNAAMAARARQAGYERLGWLTTNPTATNGGLVATFAQGEVHSTPTSPAVLVDGAILAKLRSTPALRADLGLAISEVTSPPNGYPVQRFQRGSLSIWPDGSVHRASGKLGDRDGDSRADALLIDADTGDLVWRATTAQVTAGPARRIGSGWAGFTWLSQLPDLNGDGLSELMARRGDGTLWLYRSTDANNYGAAEQVGRGWNGMRSMVVVADINGNRLPELVAIDSQQNMRTYEITGRGYLSGGQITGQNWGAIRLTATVDDFTGDGRPDLLAVDHAGRLLAYTISPRGVLASAGQVGQNWSAIDAIFSPGDLDGDGRRDLLGRSLATGDIHGYLNRGNQRWESPGVFVAGGNYLLLA